MEVLGVSQWLFMSDGAEVHRNPRKTFEDGRGSISHDVNYIYVPKQSIMKIDLKAV